MIRYYYLAVWLHAWYVNLNVGIDRLRRAGDDVVAPAGGVAVPVRVQRVVHAPAQGVQQPLLPRHQPVQVQTRPVARLDILQFAESEIIQEVFRWFILSYFA